MLHGSSPRVRGTHEALWAGGCLLRFIPACAGNTLAMNCEILAFSVHPRVCGEHDWAAPEGRYASGSSPRVRGTHGLIDYQLSRDRFIPACAGNTDDPPFRRILRPVHPRVCGEHTKESGQEAYVIGSSPRVRGTRPVLFFPLPDHRFIPACAGNTSLPKASKSAYPVHPRVCGEHFFSHSSLLTNSGSSPRVRGTHQRAISGI